MGVFVFLGEILPCAKVGRLLLERKHNKEIVPLAKNLRKNMTKEERHLWYDFLRPYEIKFLRQKVLGKYIVDFYCAKAKLVVEIDGTQHFEDDAIRYDEERTLYLKNFGVEVLRVTNLDINRNFKGVCECIDENVKRLLT